MKNSFTSQDEAERQGMAMGHRWWYGFPVAVTFPYNRSELPAGYIISSAEDIAHFMIAEMNGGRFGNSSVLSSEGITLTQTAPAGKTYAMGWETIDTGGHHLINHEGGTANFQTSVFIDPDERIGVFVGANVMCALDAFSSPRGSTPLDGTTSRGVAHSVLSLVTNQPLPDQGRGIRLLYLVFDLVLLTLTPLLFVSLVLTRTWYRRLRQRGIANWWSFAKRNLFVTITHLTLPLLLVALMVKWFFWKVLMMFQPDLCYWLQAVAAVLFVKGVVQIALISIVFHRSHGRLATLEQNPTNDSCNGSSTLNSHQ
jgi:hypothetical protein